MQRLPVIAVRTLMLFTAAWVTAAAETMPATQQNALVEKYCAVCHTDAARNGGLTLYHFDASGVDPSLAAMLASKLRGGAMGASGIARPDNATVKALVEALTAESSGAQRWTVKQAPDLATKQPVLTASVLREVPDARPPREPALYRLVLACNLESRRGEVQLSWSPIAKTGSLTASWDGNAAVTFPVQGTEAMGNGMPGAMEPAALAFGGGRFVMPARTLTIAKLFPGETIVFPFDELPQRARQTLATCFSGQ